jgi:hypothetical protein
MSACGVEICDFGDYFTLQREKMIKNDEYDRVHLENGLI